MGGSYKWFRIIGRKLFLIRSSNNNRDIITLLPQSDEQEAILRKNNIEDSNTIEDDDDHLDFAITTRTSTSSRSRSTTLLFTKEDVAAIKIQAYFRGHLARRAYGALRSIVKVQALVRGVFVRKQSRIALQCMHALVRLHVTVRSRQLLN